MILAPEPRCAADTAGAVGGMGAIYDANRARLFSCGAFFPQPRGRQAAVCCGGRQPVLVSLQTPASGAADARR